MSTSDWIDFWDTKHSIYVSPLHHTVHFRRIAEDIRAYAPQGGVMLDYGCGEALSADHVAEPVSRLILCEPAPNVRVMLGARFAGNNKIAVRKPEDIPVMAAHSMDVIVMHSVAQYLSPQQFDGLAQVFHRLLKKDGLLVLGDVIPRNVSRARRCAALASFGRQEGFFGRRCGACSARFFRLPAASQIARLTRYDAPKSPPSLRTPASRWNRPYKHRPQYKRMTSWRTPADGGRREHRPRMVKPILIRLCDKQRCLVQWCGEWSLVQTQSHSFRILGAAAVTLAGYSAYAKRRTGRWRPTRR
jgi:SAM-dependent methyltransferase